MRLLPTGVLRDFIFHTFCFRQRLWGGKTNFFYYSLTHPYLSLHSTHTSAFSVHSLVREPLAAKDMLDETHRVSIFNIWDAHAVNLLLHTRVQFFLKETKSICMVY